MADTRNRAISFVKWLATAAIIVTGVAFWREKAGLDGIWAAAGSIAGCLMAYFIIKDLFVTPLANQIRDLGLKIDALRRQIDDNRE